MPLFSAPRLSQVLPCLLVAALCLTGCQPKNTYVEPPPPEVIVSFPVEQDVTDYMEVTGMAHPVLSVDIRARVRGFLKERLVEEGSDVKQGQLLLVIDEEPFRVQLDLAKARLAEAEAALQKAKQSQSREIMRAQLALDESQLRVAKEEEQRINKLVATRAVTVEDRDRVVANREKAEAQVEASKAHLKQAEADYEIDIMSAEANVSAAKTAVRNAEIELGYCRITSPIDGRIRRLSYDVGNLVGDNQASLLTTVVKINPIYTYTNLSVDDFLKYRSAASNRPESAEQPQTIPVELELAYETGYPHHGHVDYYDPQVDKGTGTIEIRSVFPNEDGKILPGMFARLRVPIAKRPNALLLPERALGSDQTGQYILVVGEGDKVEYRKVKVGARHGDLRVVEGKIAASDRVIVEGLLRARPGIKVVPKTLAETEQVAATAPRAQPATEAQANKESRP